MKTALASRIVHALTIQRVLLGLLIIVAVGGTGSSIYFYKRYSALKANPNAEAQKESAVLMMALSRLIELPKDETPSVVTIVDKTKLADQPFFKNAENGDVLFAYVSTKEAILYRPSINKIVQVASINVSADAATQTAPLALSVAYYNGTTTAGLSAAAEKLVKEAFSTYTATSLSSAAKSDYTQTIVVDISGQHASEAEQVATAVHGVVGALPAGETAPKADLLIISGK